MKRPLLFVAIVAALVITAGARAPAASALTSSASQGDPSAAHYYLSLGDSLAQGYQPIGGTRSSTVIPTGYNQGYADQLFKLERDKYTQLQLVKLGCGGESTVSMLYGSQNSNVAASCGSPSFYEYQYPDGGTQLAEAVALLDAHRGSVAFITIDIGANDLTGPSGIGPLLTNLPMILTDLRAAAGPGVPIVGMSYYDPFAPQAYAQGGLSGLQTQVADVVAFQRPPVGLLRSGRRSGRGRGGRLRRHRLHAGQWNAARRRARVRVDMDLHAAAARPRHPCQHDGLRRNRAGVR